MRAPSARSLRDLTPAVHATPNPARASKGEVSPGSPPGATARFENLPRRWRTTPELGASVGTIDRWAVGGVMIALAAPLFVSTHARAAVDTPPVDRTRIPVAAPKVPERLVDAAGWSPTDQPGLELDARGPVVRRAQERLAALGYGSGGSTVTLVADSARP